MHGKVEEGANHPGLASPKFTLHQLPGCCTLHLTYRERERERACCALMDVYRVRTRATQLRMSTNLRGLAVGVHLHVGTHDLGDISGD